ncbi:ankyrin repeat domain-containing protein 50-like [Amblyraja radiata]|uniref:ankyrin repeat domain-containing protein 50-like n=1 Tax=Amblyraja radiata TaxID=386614 RepID=UPI0014020886|nr:ankyrin repeat domain-containing protein 50-like [Amblyraja radiata]XP_032878075.1 ankyrin repeat domain-containing protein 50-like [Amblyraja radiata]
MTGSPLRGKVFYSREWALRKLERSLHGCPGGGVVVTGGPGCGKTALCSELLWPVSEPGRRAALGCRAAAHHFCQAQDARTLAVAGFVLSLARQLEDCASLHGYRHRLQHSAAHAALEPGECARDPDHAFKRAVLLPLLDLPPPAQTLFVLVDAVDEDQAGSRDGQWPPTGPSRTIGQLLDTHHHLFPPWLILICSARTQSEAVCHMFTGFRRLCLDDLRRPAVVLDVQQYILCRLEREEVLRQQLSGDGGAESVGQLQAKCRGCLLYVERVLDAVLAGALRLPELSHIPGALPGLYLWLCQRLFSRRLFAQVRPLLNVLLAARRPLGPSDLYEAVRGPCGEMTPSDFMRRLEAVEALLRPGPRPDPDANPSPGPRPKPKPDPDPRPRRESRPRPDPRPLLLHHSLAQWLVDVKHCTRRYLCSREQGHAALAAWLTRRAGGPELELEPGLGQELALHLVRSRLQAQPWALALWLLWSGAPLSGQSLASLPPPEPPVLLLLRKAGAYEAEPGPGPAEAAGQQPGPARGAEDNGVARGPEGGEGCGSEGGEGQTRDRGLEAAELLLVESESGELGGHTPLTLSARQGHARLLQRLLDGGADPNQADGRGWTALRWAAWGGHSAVVCALLAAGGADVEGVDAEGRTALRAAAWAGNRDIALALLRRGADVNRADRQGRTPLLAAAYMGHAGMARLLIRHGARVDHRDRDGLSALALAAHCVPAARGAARLVALLLEHGAPAAQRDHRGLSPLLLAAAEGRADVAELLLEAGAPVDEADAQGRSPLQVAASLGRAAAVRTLLVWGAAVDGLDAEGRSVLGLAAAHGSEAAVRLLLERGLDPNQRDALGWTPLHAACAEGYAAACRALLEHGARVKEADLEGKSPALLAAQEGHGACVRLLLAQGAPLDARGLDGRPGLWLAALGGHAELAAELLGLGASLDGLDSSGRPLLYLLALENRVESARRLLDGAKPGLEARDPDGRSALHVCAWLGLRELARLLLERGARVDAQDRQRRSALHSAAWQGHAALLRLLVTSGAPVDQACGQGATALGIAAQEGHSEAVRVLLQAGADPDRADLHGRTPARVASKRGHAHIVRLLQGPQSPATPGDASPPSSTSATPNSSPGRSNSSSASSPRSSSTGHSRATAQTLPADSVSFAQQIQQHSLPRNRSRLSLLASSLPRPDRRGPGPVHAGREVPDPAPSPDPDPWPSPVAAGIELADPEARPSPDPVSSTSPATTQSPPGRARENGTPGKAWPRAGGGPELSPQKLGGGTAQRAWPEPLIAITSRDPELALKQAIKLRFEGPTSGYKRETPL